MYHMFAESVDFSPLSIELNYMSNSNLTNSVSVMLFNDSMIEGTEQFTIVLTTSDPEKNVILNPSSATVSISDSVTSILSELANLTATGNQTAENLQSITEVIEGLTVSIALGAVATDDEV